MSETERFKNNKLNEKKYMFIKINMEWNDDGKKLVHDEKKN